MDFETKDESTLPPECLACELMLTDALDATLTEVDQRWFDAHVGSCPACHEMLTDAKRGAAWLDMLKLTPPQPSAALFERILAQTTGAGAVEEVVPTGLIEPAFAPSVPLTATPPRPRASAGATLLSFPYIPRPSRMFFEPRLIMTAAMAFFSIALTLNLTGVRLGELHASDLNPDNLRHSFFEARASAVRTYDSMRVVHVLESRVDDLRDVASPETAPAEAPAQQPQYPSPSAAPSHAPAAPSTPNSPEDKQPQPQEKRGVSERRAPEPIRPRAARSSTMLAEVQAADASRTWPATEGGL